LRICLPSSASNPALERNDLSISCSSRKREVEIKLGRGNHVAVPTVSELYVHFLRAALTPISSVARHDPSCLNYFSPFDEFGGSKWGENAPTGNSYSR
jgi:hypothetical protein